MAVYLLTHPPPHFHSPTSLSSVSCVLFGSFNMTDGCLFIKKSLRFKAISFFNYSPQAILAHNPTLPVALI